MHFSHSVSSGGGRACSPRTRGMTRIKGLEKSSRMVVAAADAVKLFVAFRGPASWTKTKAPARRGRRSSFGGSYGHPPSAVRPTTCPMR